MNKPILIIGAGGHAAVLVDMLKQLDQEIIALVSPEKTLGHAIFDGILHLQNDDDVLQYSPQEVTLVNGIGSIPANSKNAPLRTKIYQHFKSRGYQFSSVISPYAIISPYATLAEDVQIMANTVIQTGASIGENSIINTAAVIEHDCEIGSHNHIAPGAVLSGNVHTEEHVHVGTGASVIQGINIEKNTVVGAGAVVSKNIPSDSIVYPARSSVKGKSI